ncbi:MAG: ribonuclease [Candidatus Accumulibacter sp.]|nr:ribonuclease [Accumulibacter sp.]
MTGMLVLSIPSAAARDLLRWFSAEEVPTVTLAELPPEALRTLRLIQQGGPFPFPRKDGVVFGNFEKRLPVKRRGYYREYTVPTPGLSHRGARRLVAGQGPNGDVATSGEYYYSDDHYRSFRRIRE